MRLFLFHHTDGTGEAPNTISRKPEQNPLNNKKDLFTETQERAIRRKGLFMKKASNNPQKQEYRLLDSFELKKGGVILQVGLYAPTEGTGSLKGRLLRLMEQELKKK